MKSKGIAVILVLMFALAAGAGAVAGKLTARLPAKAEMKVRPGTLSETLNLTPEQNAQMQQIWEKVRYTSRDCLSQAQQIQHEEETALQAMLTDEQKSRLLQIRQQTKDKVTALETERNTAFKDAVDHTLKILSPSQRPIYEQIIKDRIGTLPDVGTGHSSLDWNLQDTSSASR
jgi:Spy/CpxP family protein refolding chaperone